MRRWNPSARLLALACLLLGAFAGAARAQQREVVFDEVWTLKPNGDMAVTTNFTLPMASYQLMRENISNLYMILRGFASSRAEVEVAEKKAEWDDANRKVTFSVTHLGAVKNMGNHWEIGIPKGMVFTTFNEKERAFYFSVAGMGMMGPTRGTSRGLLPEGATQAKWDEGRRMVTYVMPAPRATAGMNKTLLIPGATLAGLGLLLLISSFFVSNKPAAAAPQPAQGAPPALPGK